MRLRIGYNRLANASEHCRSKSSASGKVAEAVAELRTNLTNIVNQYDQKITDLVNENTPASMAAAIETISQANIEAAECSAETNSKIIATTQQMFQDLGIDGDARRWLEGNGAKFSGSPLHLFTAEELARKAAGTEALPFPYGEGQSGPRDPNAAAGSNGQSEPHEPSTPSGTGGITTSGSNGQSEPHEPSTPSGTGGFTTSGSNGQSELHEPSTPSGTGGFTTGGSNGQEVSRDTYAAASGTQGGLTGQDTAPGGAFSPAAGGIGTPRSPSPPPPMPSPMTALGAPPGGSGMPPGFPGGGGPTQALSAGMPGGGPLGPGGPPPIPPGGAGTGGFGQPSQIPPSPSVTPMAGGALGNMAQLASPSTEVAPAAPTAGATPATPAAAPVTASPSSVPSGPVSAGPAAPSGPLPGYGADLRPAAAAVPPAPAAPAGPAGPTPPPSGPTTPASGGPTVASTGDRPAPGKPTAGVGGQSGASVAGSMGAGGTAGAGAGTAARRLAEHQDLQRKVEAVARQAPNLAWAAGLRDDEITTVLATDLAGGWIPPTVKLPPGLTLLDPAHRRPDTSAVDLLGAVIAAAAHQPNTYITEAGPNDPIPGSGERARYGQHVDELGPTLIDITGTNDRLPRIVQTVARAVARRSGVADNEIALFRQVVTDTQARVLSAYPQHAPRDVADWMLLAAIDALIDGSEELARYHLAWYMAVAVRHGGVAP